MDRYGRDFERERWGSQGGGLGRRGGFQGQGGEFGMGGGQGGRFSGSEDDFGDEGIGRGGSRGMMGGGFGEEFGGGRGERGGGEFGGRQGGFRGGSFGGFGGPQGGGMGRGRGGGMQGGGMQGGMSRGGMGMGGGGYGGGYGGGMQGGFGDSMGEQRGGWGGGMGMSGGMDRDDESNRLRAAEIMTENPETVTPEATLADAARKMRDLNVGIIPVVESDSNRRLKGVITDRDIAIRAVAEGKDVNSIRVSDVMTTEIETCNKNDTVREILNVMQREQVRRVPITDREGRLVGIVAQADVAVDFLEDRPQGKREVARMLRQVSEPGEPEGSGGRGGQRPAARRASQQRDEE